MYKTRRIRFSFLLYLFIQTCFGLTTVRAQEVYQHVSNSDVYDFIDELANAGVIQINSAIKPYSRIFIAKKLGVASGKREELNPRQIKDLDFYLKDYNK